MKKSANIFLVVNIMIAIMNVSIYSQIAEPVKVKGDKEGMEINFKFQLERDKLAAEEALNGWWKNSMKDSDKRIDWYKEAKFGCFVHWGVYASAAGEWNGKIVNGYAEHLMRKETISLKEYKEKLVAQFNPVEFDADEWMRNVKDAGMKYFIITSKHHDGFAMFYSDVYPYDMRLTKFKRDPMMELKKAAEKYGIKFGFYYSHAFDWEHPDAPGNDWDYDNPAGDKLLHGGKDWWLSYPEFLERTRNYVEKKSIPQIRELITKYKPDILWFDTPAKLPLYENIGILKAIREIDQNVVVNGRLARFGNYNLGDYKNTGDRAANFFPVEGIWESIPTTNESYGYSKHDKSHKPPVHFVQLLATAASRGGNVLMNVGPMGNGKWDSTDLNIFKTVGEWLKINGESIYGSERSPLSIQSWGVVTKKENSFYLHVYDWPKDGKLIVGGLNAKVKKIFLLSDKSKKEITCLRINGNDMQIDLPSAAPDSMNSVIVLNVEGTINAEPTRLLSSKDYINKLLAFDGELHGNGLSYGDGKPNREYVSGWKNNNQWISWKFRLNEPAEFKVSLNYNTAGDKDAGTVFIEMDEQKYPMDYKPITESKGSISLEAGKFKFDAGEHIIKLTAGNYSGGELMRPLFITMKPL